MHKAGVSCSIYFTATDLPQFYKLLRFVTWRAFSFWNVVAFVTDTLLVVAFVIRLVGLRTHEDEEAIALRLKSFQVLSFVSPLIWSV
jgi:hypothetical protein